MATMKYGSDWGMGRDTEAGPARLPGGLMDTPYKTSIPAREKIKAILMSCQHLGKGLSSATSAYLG